MHNQSQYHHNRTQYRHRLFSRSRHEMIVDLSHQLEVGSIIVNIIGAAARNRRKVVVEIETQKIGTETAGTVRGTGRGTNVVDNVCDSIN